MVEGVALELLCRLLFTEGSNPSLSLPLPNSRALLTTMDQITNKQGIGLFQEVDLSLK